MGNSKVPIRLATLYGLECLATRRTHERKLEIESA